MWHSVSPAVHRICSSSYSTHPDDPEHFGLRRDGNAPSQIIAEHKLGRFGQPEEIAACFLLSPDASFITGRSVIVDGGYTSGRDHGVTEMPGLSGRAPRLFC
jgi:NAD(P)-dependent dehydrogenase (short-subunit alcohol dehydrogenase family)